MQPSTLSGAESSRINGAKSHGPVTDQGKARSSVNAFKTGIYSKRVVLPNEDMNEFLAFRTQYFLLFQPDNPLETDLVEDMVNARWRIQRIEQSETCNMSMGIGQAIRETEWLQSRERPEFETTVALRKMSSQGRMLDTLARHEARYRRAFDRALKTFQQLRSKSVIPLPTYADIENALEQEKRRNEPETASSETKNEGMNLDQVSQAA